MRLFRNILPESFSRVCLGLTPLLFILFCAFPVQGQSAGEESSEESIEAWKRTVEEEVDAFMRDFRKHTADSERVREERKTLQEKVDDFLADLQQHTENPESAHKKLDAWLEQRRREMGAQEGDWLDKAVFHSKVFFGGWAGFFLFIAALFVLKLMFNITLDSFVRFGEWCLGLFGLRVRTGVEDHFLSPLSTAVRQEDYDPAPGTEVEENPRPKTAIKKFLFGEVLLQFVNPFLNRDRVTRALQDQQEMPHPRPKIGEILVQREVIEPEEIEMTLKKQRRFRRGKR